MSEEGREREKEEGKEASGRWERVKEGGRRVKEGRGERRGRRKGGKGEGGAITYI